MIHEAASSGFGRSAEAYVRGRPDYPDEAIDWLWNALGLGAGSRVVDVGAGTGKLTAPLVERGADVTAVEPVDAMRERITVAPAIEGTAEQLPIDSETADAVICGQAFHWFANERALGEFHRVLRRGGGLGLIWNRRPLDDPLHAAISELLDPLRGDTPHHASGNWRPPLEQSPLFEAAGSHEAKTVQELDREGLVDRVGSTSFVAVLADEPRGQLLDRVRTLVLAEETAHLPYVCETYVYCRCS